MAAAGHGIVLNAWESDSTREPGRRGELSDGTYGARASSPSREVPVRCSRESRASQHGAAEPLSVNQPVDALFRDAPSLSTGPENHSAPHHSAIQCSNRAFNTCHGLLDGPCSVSAFWHFLIGHPDAAARVSPPSTHQGASTSSTSTLSQARNVSHWATTSRPQGRRDQ